MRNKNQTGSMIIGIAVFMAVLAGVIYFYSSMKMMQVTSQYRRTQSMAFAHEISSNLATNLRWAYDLATPATICTLYGGTISTVPGSAIQLCSFTGANLQICTTHPGNILQPICISLKNNTITAKRDPFSAPARLPELRPGDGGAAGFSWAYRLLFPNRAMAQGYAPAAPPGSETNNNLAAIPNPKCLGGICDVKCGPAGTGNADCLSFTFCPLMGGKCEDTEWVTQTVAFFH